MEQDVKNPGANPGSVLQKPLKLQNNTKRAAVVEVFIKRGPLGLTCFEAVRLAHDYVLRSTVSDLYRLYGLTFNRKWERVPGHAGSVVDCIRYSLDSESIERARGLLGSIGKQDRASAA